MCFGALSCLVCVIAVVLCSLASHVVWRFVISGVYNRCCVVSAGTCVVFFDVSAMNLVV